MDMRKVIGRLFVLPAQQANAQETAEVWLGVLHGQPLAGVYYAFDKFIRDPSREFRPTPGQFLAVVVEYAERVKSKCKALKQAIEAEKGSDNE